MRWILVAALVGCSNSSMSDASMDVFDGGTDGGFDVGADVGTDVGTDVGRDVGGDVGIDAFDAGPPDSDGDGVTADEDCDDDDPSVWMLLPGFVDTDADAFGVGAELNVCSGDALPEGYAEVGGDCDDDDTDNWASCATCVDEDDDDWFVGCDRYVTREGPDCDDDASSSFREVEVAPDTDGDGRGSGVGEVRCLGYLGVGLGEGIGTGDCDESNDLRRPGMPELPDDGVDNDCDGFDRSVLDDDGIYVAREHADCQALTPGSRTRPNCTLATALGFSVEGDVLYVAEGTYDSTLDIESRSLFGGYDSSDWTLGGTTILDSGSLIEVAGTVGMTRLSIRDDVEAFDAALFVHDCEMAEVTALRSHLVLADSQLSGSLNGSFFASGLVTRTTITTDSEYAFLVGGISPFTMRDSSATGATGCYVEGFAEVSIERSACIGTAYRGVGHVGSNSYLYIVNSYLRGGNGDRSEAFADSGNGVVVNSTLDAGDGTTRRVGLTMAMGLPTVAINNVIVVRGIASDRTAAIEVIATLGTRMANNLLYAPVGDILQHGLSAPMSLAELNACAWTGCTAASGNISVDPMLAPDGIHLMSGSPAIDQGVDPATISGGFAVTTDYDGDARPARSGWDIGADEVP